MPLTICYKSRAGSPKHQVKLCEVPAVVSAVDNDRPLGSHLVSVAQVHMKLSTFDARHLLTRAGFTPSPGEVAPWVGMTAEAAVDKLLADARRAQPLHPAPAFTREAIQPPYGRLPDDEARKVARQQARADTVALAAWWLQEMRETSTPLAERMVLFWHNHFATSM